MRKSHFSQERSINERHLTQKHELLQENLGNLQDLWESQQLKTQVFFIFFFIFLLFTTKD